MAGSSLESRLFRSLRDWLDAGWISSFIIFDYGLIALHRGYNTNEDATNKSYRLPSHRLQHRSRNCPPRAQQWVSLRSGRHGISPRLNGANF